MFCGDGMEGLVVKEVVHFSSFVSTICIGLFDSLSPTLLPNADGFSLLLLLGVYGEAVFISLTYFVAMEWKEWLSREWCTSCLLVSTVCIGLFDSIAASSHKRGWFLSTTVTRGVWGSVDYLSSTYFEAMEWKDWLSRECCTPCLLASAVCIGLFGFLSPTLLPNAVDLS
jgi:hypothetical protein